jgi:CRISPR system Cascade subunit CasA
MENKFNLVDEPWIPVVGTGLVSLAETFSNPKLSALGGNPVQKIALIKLLLAIAQTAYTPKDDDDWRDVGADGLAKKTQSYLINNKDLFWLYGEKPFLQIPSIIKAEVQSFGAVQAYIASGNTTVLMQSQVENKLSEAEKAVLLIQMMGFGLGGKKTDNSVVLSASYKGKANDKGKPSTGKPGTSVGFLGLLHSFMLGSCLRETIWLNLLNEEDIKDIRVLPEGLGIAPWHKMPKGEDCSIAKSLRNSYMGRLIPVSRFVFVVENGMHYSEGIAHPGYADGVVDASMAVDNSKSKIKVLWSDPAKKPWRQLTSLLSFMDSEKKVSYDCLQLRLGVKHVKRLKMKFGVWSGGLRVSSNAGEQYVSGSDDYVESEVQLNTEMFTKGTWFSMLTQEMDMLDKFSKIAYSTTMGYYKAQNATGKEQAAEASNLFWQLCERKFQLLVDACACDDVSGEKLKALRKIFSGIVDKAYNTYCPNDTARQLDAWAAHKPALSTYLSNKEG